VGSIPVECATYGYRRQARAHSRSIVVLDSHRVSGLRRGGGGVAMSKPYSMRIVGTVGRPFRLKGRARRKAGLGEVRLTPDEVRLLIDWRRAGASWADAVRLVGIRGTSG